MIGVLRSLATTFKTALRKPVTIQYPMVHKAVPQAAKGIPLLTWDHKTDSMFCIGCHQCERFCPTECITVIMDDNNPRFRPKDHDENTCSEKLATGTCPHTSPRRTAAEAFYIDEGRCMRCNICVEVCPTDKQYGEKAIVLDNTHLTWELAVVDRTKLCLDMEQLLAPSKAGILTSFKPESRKGAAVFVVKPSAILQISFRTKIKIRFLKIYAKISPRWRKKGMHKA